MWRPTRTHTRTHTGGRPIQAGVCDKEGCVLPSHVPAACLATGGGAPRAHCPGTRAYLSGSGLGERGGWHGRRQPERRGGRAEESGGRSRRCGPTCRPIGGGAGRAQGGGGVMDGLSARCGPISGRPSNVNKGLAPRGPARPCTQCPEKDACPKAPGSGCLDLED